MCNVCGIVSEKFRPESTYWKKMCEYITKTKAFMTKGCFAAGRGDCFFKKFAGKECFAIVDGKIHNSNALKRNLDLKGEPADTGNIAELVLLCYILLGERCFKLFKGEFCAVIWNGCDQELILVRDKVGINTLFYYFDGLRMAFSSEIKGVLKFPFVKKELSDDIYCKLFTLAGSRSQGETLFLNIYEVPAGCYVKYKDFKREIKNYHTFCVKDSTDNLSQTLSAFKYLCKGNSDMTFMDEKAMSKERLKDNIERFVEASDFPSPYIDLKTLSNLESADNFTDLTGIFNAPSRFKLPTAWCKKQDKEFINSFLSTLPWFEYKDEKDIAKKEEIYIKQYIVLPQVVYARKKACKNMLFPFLGEEIVDYSLKSLKYAKRLSKEYALETHKKNKENYKNLKSLFNEMISSENAMSGLIEKEELLKFTRLFPRPETMLYLLQVDMWLNMFL